jgi:hypothetical protein
MKGVGWSIVRKSKKKGLVDLRGVFLSVGGGWVGGPGGDKKKVCFFLHLGDRVKGEG